MSFSRAKLQRFNEAQNGTPSPADYNVKTKGHITGAALTKSDRFVELRSPSQNSDNSSFMSNSSASVFRTPSIPRKLKQQKPSTTSRDSNNKPTKAVELFNKSDELEALNEKIVECNNKDLFIQDLTDQLEELKLQLNNYQLEIDHLNGDKLNLEGDIERLNEEHETVRKDLQIKYQQYLANLHRKFIILNEKMEEIKKEKCLLKEQTRKDLADILQWLNAFQQSSNKLTHDYQLLIDEKNEQLMIKDEKTKDLQKEIDHLIKHHQQTLEDLKSQHELQIKDIDNKAAKASSIMEDKIKLLQKNHEESLKQLEELKNQELKHLELQLKQDKENIKSDLEAKIKQLTENYEEAKLLAEMQMKEKCNDIEMNWKLKLDEAKQESDAILKECQAIAEYNIIQTEIEKNKAIYEASERIKETDELKEQNMTLKTNHYDLNEKYKQLQIEMNSMIAEMNETREDFTKEHEDYKNTIEKLMKDKHTYEVTIMKTHKTIETLKKRLMRSDKDVEQLKAELEATEESKIEIEGRCNQLMDELDIVCGLCDDMEQQNQIALQIKEEKVLQVEQDLLSKLEAFKQEAVEQVNSKTEQLNKTEQDLLETLTHLHAQQKLHNEAQTLIDVSKKEIERLEHVNDEQINKNNNLEVAFANLQQELRLTQNKELTLKETNESLKKENRQLQDQVLQTEVNNKYNNTDDLKNYQELNEKYNLVVEKLNEAEEQNKRLQKKVDEQEALIGPFREHLEAYEMEYKALFSQKQDAEKEAKEMGLKYAEILGHQNQRQKIKHLVDLKKKNNELIENKKELENKVRSLNRNIEKLKKELSNPVSAKLPKTVRQQKEDKENMVLSSPSRANNLNVSRHDSPGGPFKDRN